MSSELLLGTLPGPRITSGTSRERRSVVGHPRQQERVGPRIGDGLLEARALFLGVTGEVVVRRHGVDAVRPQVRGHLVLELRLHEFAGRHGDHHHLAELAHRPIRRGPAGIERGLVGEGAARHRQCGGDQQAGHGDAADSVHRVSPGRGGTSAARSGLRRAGVLTAFRRHGQPGRSTRIANRLPAPCRLRGASTAVVICSIHQESTSCPIPQRARRAA